MNPPILLIKKPSTTKQTKLKEKNKARALPRGRTKQEPRPSLLPSPPRALYAHLSLTPVSFGTATAALSQRVPSRSPPRRLRRRPKPAVPPRCPPFRGVSPHGLLKKPNPIKVQTPSSGEMKGFLYRSPHQENTNQIA